MAQLNVKKTPNTLPVILTLTQENAEALKDYGYWTGADAESILNRAFAEYMELVGEEYLWDIARDPKKRAEAFQRNKMSEKKIARCNASLDGTFAKSRAETKRQNAQILKAKRDSAYHAFGALITSHDQIRAKSLGILLD
jgi:hypothetical protein